MTGGNMEKPIRYNKEEDSIEFYPFEQWVAYFRWLLFEKRKKRIEEKQGFKEFEKTVDDLAKQMGYVEEVEKPEKELPKREMNRARKVAHFGR